MIRLLPFFFVLVASGLALVAGVNYKGNVMIYGLFTLIANALLLNGFRRRSIYFDTFIGIFLWLGFWFKFSFRVAFTSGQFREAVGAFDGSASSLDHALIVSSCGIGAFLVAGLIRERLFIYPADPVSCVQTGLFRLYQSFRKYLVGCFVLVVLVVTVSNAVLGIYQRGMVAQTVLPFGLNGVFTWLLQFGLASISALILRYEIELNQNLSLTAVFVPILESFLCSASLLSRGMILNCSALGVGCLRLLGTMKPRPDRAKLLVAIILFISLFIVSIFAVNYLRAGTLRSSEVVSTTAVARDMAPPLFIDRWVGIEGVLAVSSSNRLGWGLWQEAWEEIYQQGRLSLFDRYFIDSPYTHPDIDKSINHFVSLPGLVAFLYYPGSLVFLFTAVLACALFASCLEMASYRFCGHNLILSALLAQVIAFRYASFGYVPGQSYLLFGTLVLNGLFIFTADSVLRRYFMRRESQT